MSKDCSVNRWGRRKHQLFLIVGFILVFETLFYRSNSMEFGRLDDFSGLANNRTETLMEGVFHVFFQSGRFIPAILQSLLFRVVSSVTDLQYLRFVSTAVLALSGAIIAQFSLKWIGLRNRKNQFLSIFVGVIAITTTAAPSAATWAILAVLLLAMPIA